MLIALTLVVTVLGASPLLLAKRWKAAAIAIGAYAVLGWPILYFANATTASPMFGLFGGLVLIETISSTVVAALLEDDLPKVAVIPLALLLAFGVRAGTGCNAFRAKDKAAMIGEMAERTWTEDIQPADPKHIRLVPTELAEWLANKQLGEAGSIGSQFQIGTFALQRVKGELWYVAALDYRGFTAWNSTDFAPGYVMVSAEDPERHVVIKSDLKFQYSPDAFMSKNLKRHLLQNGYRDRGLMDPSLEIDEQGEPWWVVTVYRPAIAWWGEEILGVAVVDPANGAITFHAVGQVPDWIDRVFPASTVNQYIKWWGELQNGWVNSWWGKKDVLEPEDTHLVYGTDGDPYWVTAVTSKNQNDESLVYQIYTDVRTGKSTRYKASGGTDAAVLQSVNNKVSYKRQHGSSPVIYNVNGTMAAIIPLLGENHTFQGVAIVSIENPQRVAIGSSFGQALLSYQAEIAKTTQGPGIEVTHDQQTIEGNVLRIGQESHESGATYRMLIEGQSQIFAGGTELSPELSLTQPGDTVQLTFRTSKENVVPLVGFDNLAIELSAPKAPPVPPESPPSK